MLEEFLKKLGSVLGKTYTKEEFASIIKEATAKEKPAVVKPEDDKK